MTNHTLRPDSSGWDFRSDTPYRSLISQHQHALREDREALGADFLQTFADWSADPVNKKLLAAGFPDMQLPELGDGIYMGAVAKTGKKNWLINGNEQDILIKGRWYPGFRLRNDLHGVRFLRGPFSSEPIISIPTNSGWHARILPCEKKPESITDLWALAVQIMKSTEAHEAQQQFDGVVLPCVNIDTKPDISELEEMGLLDTAYVIQVAMQQVRVVINRFGFSAEAAASAVALECCIRADAQPNCYIVDKPFICCFVAGNQAQLPMFPAWYTTDVFKEGDLR